MKWLMRLNVLAAVVYASFVASILVADVWILPRLDVLSAPPETVGLAIREGGDADGLRQIALVLFDHLTEQTAVVNELIAGAISWARWHFLIAFGLACVNVALLIRLRKAVAGQGGGRARN